MSEPQPIGTAIEAGDLVAMRRALRALVDASPLSMATIEAMAGLPRNYLPKILGEPPVRGLTSYAIYSLLPIVGHKIALIPDPEAERRMKARHDYVICDERQRRKGGSHHRTAKALALVSRWGQEGAKKLLESLTKEEISLQRSRAARARWRKFRKEKRQARVRKSRRAGPATESRAIGTFRAAAKSVAEPGHSQRRFSGNAAPKARARLPSPAMPG